MRGAMAVAFAHDSPGNPTADSGGVTTRRLRSAILDTRALAFAKPLSCERYDFGQLNTNRIFQAGYLRVACRPSLGLYYTSQRP